MGEPAGAEVVERPEAASAPEPGAVRVSPWLLVPALVAPGLVVFVLPMIGLITRNAEYFDGDLGAGRRVYVAGALFVAVGVGLWVLRRTLVGRVALICYLLVPPAYVVYTLLADVRRTAVLLVVGLAVVAIAVVVARSGTSVALTRIAAVGVVILVANAASTYLEAAAPSDDEVAAQHGGDDIRPAPAIADRPSATDHPNVYHLIFDELQVDQFELALDDRSRDALRGFTEYPEAMTTYGRTEMALTDMFDSTGYDYSLPASRFAQRALLDPTSTLQQLREAGYQTTGYIPNRSLWNEADMFDEVVVAADAVQNDPGADYSDLATSIWIDATAPDALTRRIIPPRHYEQLTTKALLPDDEPAIAVQAFRSFLNREQREAPTGRYTAVHVIIPHRPWVLTHDCGYTPGVDTDPVSQAGCALHLVDELVDELDSLGRLESSTIVIQGDHGAGLTRTGDTLSTTESDPFSIEWSTTRSRPALLVKPAGVGRGEPLATSDRRALTTDVMPTIFDSVDLPIDAADDRVSLLADEFPDRPERHYHFYDKGFQGLPEETVVRYVERDGVLAKDEVVPIPPPR